MQSASRGRAAAAETATRRRDKRHRPLSQTGLRHTPKNPLQRVPGEGGVKAKREALEAFNERQVSRYLHPTKGWRGLNVRRSRAQALVAAIMDGQRINTEQMGRFIRTGKVNAGLL